MEPALSVVVADDEEDIRLLCRVNLEADGFVVHEAANPAQLMSIVHEIEPLHAIILDVTLPDRDGIDVLADLKADHSVAAVPVVMLSGHVGEESRSRALALGAAAYVTKPFRPADLLRVIRSVIGA